MRKISKFEFKDSCENHLRELRIVTVPHLYIVEIIIYSLSNNSLVTTYKDDIHYTSK